jgi:P-type E1-E2 ATPase
MNIGTSFSLWRLRKKGIFCISPPRVNVSGRVNVMVLDKTGTLTEDGLQVYGFRAVKGANITQVQDSSAAKPAVEFEKFIETIDHVTHNVNDKDWFTS